MNMLPYSGIPALPKNIEDMHNQLVALGLNDVEALTARIKKCEDWVDAVEETEFTGNPVVFQNALAVPAASLEANIEPIQDLHGYDHPWAGGAGKNLLPMTVSGIKALNTDGTWNGNTYTRFGATYTINTDSDGNIISFTAKGTPTLNFDLKIYNNFTTPSECIMNGCPVNGGVNRYYLYVSGTSYSDTGSGVTVPANATGLIYCRVFANFALPSNGIEFKPMIRLSTVTDSTFAPYTNICPISGRTGTSVTTTNEDESESSSVTIQLGQTVYGGQVDFKTGRVTVTKASVDMGSIEWTYDSSKAFFKYTMPSTFKNNSSLVCSIYPYKGQRNDGQMDMAEYGIYDVNTTIKVKDTRYTDATAYTTAVTGQTLCYELATPTELTLTPEQLQMLKGYNSVSSDDASSLTVTAYTGGPWEPITRAIKKVTNKTKTTKKRRK